MAAGDTDRGSTVLFVTVGTTSFDAFVAEAATPAFAAAARRLLGVRARVVLQVGRGQFAPPASAGDIAVLQTDPASGVPSAWRFTIAPTPAPGGTRSRGSGAPQVPVPYEAFRFKATLAADVESAAVILSHAGAGSVFEALRAGKPLLVVVNTALADNHQVELAEALAARGEASATGGPHLAWCEPAGLVAALDGLRVGDMRPLPEADLTSFVESVDRLMGFASLSYSSPHRTRPTRLALRPFKGQSR